MHRLLVASRGMSRSRTEVHPEGENNRWITRYQIIFNGPQVLHLRFIVVRLTFTSNFRILFENDRFDAFSLKFVGNSQAGRPRANDADWVFSLSKSKSPGSSYEGE